jgi:hypothetical protein
MIGRLTKKQIDALVECAEYGDMNRFYYWRVASMRVLEERCFVVGLGKPKRWIVTDAGREFLKGFPK